MSEMRVNRYELPRTGNSRLAYVEPIAEWHDLRVITLGGPSGTGDSGAENSQVLAGSFHYDESDDDYGNYA